MRGEPVLDPKVLDAVGRLFETRFLVPKGTRAQSPAPTELWPISFQFRVPWPVEGPLIGGQLLGGGDRSLPVYLGVHPLLATWARSVRSVRVEERCGCALPCWGFHVHLSALGAFQDLPRDA